MGRTASDPELLELANRLDAYPFPDSKPIVGRPRYVYPWSSEKWCVKLFISGRQRTIGVTSRLDDAARYADMAVCLFWNYHSPGEPSLSDLNYPLADTKELLKSPFHSVQTTVLHLTLIGHHLLAQKIFKRPEENEAVREEISNLEQQIMEFRNRIRQLKSQL